MSDQKIIDFKTAKAEKTSDKVATAIAIQTAIDITQELNCLMHYMKEVDVKADKMTLLSIKQDYGNDYMYIAKELCLLHGNNLKMLGEAISRFTDDPGKEKAAELHNVMRQLPNNYAEDSIVNRIIREALQRGTAIPNTDNIE